MKFFRFIFLFFCLLFLMINCSKAKKDTIVQNEEEDIVIEAILPQRAYFSSVRNQMKGIEWGKYIYKDGIKNYKEELSGFQIGILLTNCGIASAINDDKLVKKLSDQIIDISNKMNITNEQIVYEIIEIAKSFDDLIKEEKYNEISTKIQEIESKLKNYYKDTKNEQLIEQIKFGSWLEALYIVSKAIKDNYKDELTNLLNREQEARYFLKNLSLHEKYFKNEIDFLMNIKLSTNNESDKINIEKLNNIINTIEKLRTNYIV